MSRPSRLTIIVAALVLSCCTKRRYTTEEMEWSTDPIPGYPHARPLPPGALRLTYTSWPDYHVVITGVPELLDHLKRSGRRVVLVKFEVTCAWNVRAGWKATWAWEVAVDGQPIPASAGGSAESTGRPRFEDPLNHACP